MAEDTNLKLNSERPCCAKTRARFLKLKQSRNFLRTALQRLEPKVALLQSEKIQLQKAHDAELKRAQLRKAAKEKEIFVRDALEKEITNLKSRLVSLQKNNLDRNYDGKIAVLKTRVSELEGETARLRELLEEARQKAHLEKKIAEEDKIKYEQAEKEAKLKESTSRYDFIREILYLKSEIAALKESKGKVDRNEEEVNLLRTRVLDGKEEISKLIELLDNEKKNGEMEMKKVLAEKNKYEEAWKIEVEARTKASSAQAGLENDISKLKSRIDLLLAQRDLRDQEVLLQTCVSEEKVESNRFKMILDQEKERANLEKEIAEEAIETETRPKEFFTRADLENKYLVLKAMIDSLLAERDTKNQKEGSDLKNHILEVEAENKLLKELLDQEKKRGYAEKQKAKEAWKIEAEARSKEASLRASSKNENFGLKSNITSLLTERDSKNQEGCQIVLRQPHVFEGEAENYRLKELLGQESRKVIAEKKKARREKEKAKAWKSEAEAKQKAIVSFENEIFKLKFEKKKADEERRLADIERNISSECRPSLEVSPNEVSELRVELVSEKFKVEEAHKKIEIEKQVANREKKRAELEMEKAEQWKRSVEEEKKKLMDEICHSTNLFCKLEVERQRSETLKKEIQELKVARKTENDQHVTFSVNKKADGELMLLEKELKLEKMHVKHAKKVAKFEKMRNNILGKELYHLKQELSHFDYRLKALDGCFSSGCEGIDAPAEINNSLNPHFKSAVECTAPLFDGRRSTKILGSLIGESTRSKLQNSAVYSTSASFSGGLSFGSQENNIFSLSRPDNMKENSKQGSIFPRLSAESTNPRISGNLGIIAENSCRTPVHRDMDIPSLSLNKHGDINVVSRGTAPKRKRLPDEAEYLCSKLCSFPTQIEEKLSAVTDSLIPEKNIPRTCCSQMDGELNSSGDGRSQTIVTDNKNS